MKKDILKKAAAMLLVIAITAGCSSQTAASAAATAETSSTAPVTTTAESKTTTAAATTAKPKTTTSAAATAKPVTTTTTAAAVQEPEEEYYLDFVGCYLSDVYDLFKEYGITDYLVYESDNGNSIIVKSNWAVIDQRMQGDYIIVTCEKVRNTGLISAAAKKINAFFEKDGVKETFDALKNIKDVGETWSYFKGLFKKDE